MENEKYMTLKEVSDLAHIPYATVKRDIDNGVLPAYKVGRKYFIALKDGQTYAKHKQEILSTQGYTIKELQEILPLSYAFIIELIKSHKLHAIKSGRRYIIPHAEFHRFLESSSLK